MLSLLQLMPFFLVYGGATWYVSWSTHYITKIIHDANQQTQSLKKYYSNTKKEGPVISQHYEIITTNNILTV